MLEKIQRILDDYQPVSLEEIESVKLMNRLDTKYIVSTETMMNILHQLSNDYMLLEINSQRFGQYSSIYYDTIDFQMFHAHITSRYPRFKVRERTYSQNGMQFLEVKRKKITGRTSKKRLSLLGKTGFDDTKYNFVADYSPFCMKNLQPQLHNQFNRITLINKDRTERLTFDFDLQFRSFNGNATPIIKNAAIIEVKQNKRTGSVITRMLRDENIRPCGMSKYCVGMLLIHNHLNHKMYQTKFVKFKKIAQWV